MSKLDMVSFAGIAWDKFNITMVKKKGKMINCYAKDAAEEFNTHKQFPDVIAEDWVSQMTGFGSFFHDKDGKFKKFLAEFRDGSILIWIDPLLEWGFAYRTGVNDPYIEAPAVYSLPGG